MKSHTRAYVKQRGSKYATFSFLVRLFGLHIYGGHIDAVFTISSFIIATKNHLMAEYGISGIYLAEMTTFWPKPDSPTKIEQSLIIKDNA